MRPLLSIITPCHNSIHFMNRMLEIFAKWRDKNIEWVLVDDCSHDATAVKLIEFKKNNPELNIVIVENKTNSGPGVSRNNGIEIAKGEYLTFLDSDDLFLPEKLEYQINYMAENNLVISHTDEFWYRKDRWINQGKSNKRYGGYIFDKILDKCRISPSSLIVHKSVFDEAGYFNEDVLTADYNADVQALAQDEAAFCFYGNSGIVDTLAVNPDANLGMMPIPSASTSDEPSLIAGEDIAVGVWKDSKVQDEAVELLNYLAQPEVTKTIAEAAGNKAGLNGVETDIGSIGEYYDKYADVETFPYFDREYLPSGMWDVMCATGADILSQKEGAVQTAATTMEQNFNDKYGN